MKSKLSVYRASLVAAISNSPIEIFISLIIFIIEMVEHFYNEYKIPLLTKLTMFYYSSFAVAVAFNIMFKRKRIFYYLSILFPVIIYLYLSVSNEYSAALLITTISSILLIFASYKEKENKIFTSKAINTILNVVISIFLALMSALLLYSIIESLNYIFDININKHSSADIIQYISTYIVLPILFLTLNHKNSDELKVDKFTEVMINYILTPTLLIYGIILYCYFAKVIITWELPDGVVSTTAILFLAIGIIVKASRELSEKRVIGWFFKYISYISIPALIMLWIGSTYRIWEYGFTENRTYLMVTVVILTIWNFAQLWSKTNKYLYLTVLTIVAFNIACHAPIDYDSIKRKSKTNETIDHHPYYIKLKEVSDINIMGYNNIILVDHYLIDNSRKHFYLIDNDTLFFKFKQDSTTIVSISTKVILDSLYKYTTVKYPDINNTFVSDLESNAIIFKNDTIIIPLLNMSLEHTKDGVKIRTINIDQIIKK